MAKSWGQRLERQVLNAHGVRDGEQVPADVHALAMDVGRVLEHLDRHVEITPARVDRHRAWCVGAGHKRQGQVGQLVASIGLRHASGYVCVLRFPDGALESFGPHTLHPHQEAPADG